MEWEEDAVQGHRLLQAVCDALADDVEGLGGVPAPIAGGRRPVGPDDADELDILLSPSRRLDPGDVALPLALGVEGLPPVSYPSLLPELEGRDLGAEGARLV